MFDGFWPVDPDGRQNTLVSEGLDHLSEVEIGSMSSVRKSLTVMTDESTLEAFHPVE